MLGDYIMISHQGVCRRGRVLYKNAAAGVTFRFECYEIYDFHQGESPASGEGTVIDFCRGELVKPRLSTDKKITKKHKKLPTQAP
mmetsp:Transcript_20847/g.25564  ORF Transcript_20847/g.25564 Transcript_20847/m.25564 type:complete len:85 (+) Transcript_20847:532-786(+)